MKRHVIKTLLPALAALLLVSGCVTTVKYRDTGFLHQVRFSMKNGVPCFAIKDDLTLLQSAAEIDAITVSQFTEMLAVPFSQPFYKDFLYLWTIKWQTPVRLGKGECIQYGSNTGRHLYIFPEEKCKDSHPKDPQNVVLKQFPSGECVVDDTAQKLETGVTYFINIGAEKYLPEKDIEEHYIQDFFCLTDNKNGETIVHRLKHEIKIDTEKRLGRYIVESCPGAKNKSL
jgi:hypothetical protein